MRGGSDPALASTALARAVKDLRRLADEADALRRRNAVTRLQAWASSPAILTVGAAETDATAAEVRGLCRASRPGALASRERIARAVEALPRAVAGCPVRRVDARSALALLAWADVAAAAVRLRHTRAGLALLLAVLLLALALLAGKAGRASGLADSRSGGIGLGQAGERQRATQRYPSQQPRDGTTRRLDRDRAGKLIETGTFLGRGYSSTIELTGGAV